MVVVVVVVVIVNKGLRVITGLGQLINNPLWWAPVDFFLGNKQRTLTRILSRQLLLPSWIEY